jgi:hypothetical protein
MLPFLKRNVDASASGPVQRMDTTPDDGSDEHEAYDSMESAMEDLCNAIKSSNYKAAAEAFRSALDLKDDSKKEDNK